MKPLTYGSLFSGVEAASLAVKDLGFVPKWFAEIDPFCCAVLAHRFPHVPNLGDVSQIKAGASVDVVFAGAPCQAFSCAGSRGGLDDPRGNLTLEWLRVVGRTRPRWFVFENVAGLLTVDKGRTFGLLLAALSELGYGLAWRVLDARYFGVAQRRRRVYLVGRLGGSVAPAGAVLFEPNGVPGRADAGAPAREGSAARARGRARGGRGTGVIAFSEKGGGGGGIAVEEAQTLRSQPTDKTGHRGGINGQAVLSFDHCAGASTNGIVSETGDVRCLGSNGDGGRSSSAVLAFKQGSAGHGGGVGHEVECAPTLGSAPSGTQGSPVVLSFDDSSGASARSVGAGNDVAPCLGSTGDGNRRSPAVFALNNDSRGSPDELAYALRAGERAQQMVTDGFTLRRLTPRECERLMGFPDDWTNVPWRGKPTAPDAPRYRVIGNSFVVPKVKWIAERILAVERALAR